MAGITINIDEIIDSVNIVEKLAKSGNPYKMLQIKLDDGIEIEVMVDRGYMALLESRAKGAKKTT